MKGKELERLTLHRLEAEEREGRCCAGRYGVQGSFHDGEWRPISSLPDIEGILFGGRQFITDCKVTKAPSLPLDKLKGPQLRQLRHMLERSRFGAICFLLIHFEARELKRTSEPPLTVAFPIAFDHPFWVRFQSGEEKRITRQDAETYGVPIEWNAPGRMKNPTPDVLAAVLELSTLLETDQ